MKRFSACLLILNIFISIFYTPAFAAPSVTISSPLDGSTHSTSVSFSSSASSHYSLVSVLDSSLIAWWPLNNNGSNGLDLTDKSENSNTLTNFSATYFASGKLGAAAQFSGTSQYLRAGSSVTLTTKGAISAWVYADGFRGSANPRILGNSANSYGQILVQDGTHKLSVYTQSHDMVVTNYVFPADSAWHFVLLNWGPSGGDLYVDNASVWHTDTAVNLNSSSFTPEIGYGIATDWWTGKIDDVMYFNTTLTSDEITALYNGTAVSHTSTLALGSHTYKIHAQDTSGVITSSSTNTFTVSSATPTPTPTTYYTLAYVAGSNGSISGSTNQTVLPGGSGSSVTAIANAHYHFANWSDASTDNPRTDTNVLGNISVTANFSIDTYSVTYSAGSNGSISGSTNQTVNYGADTSQVTAVADSLYHFTNWSDGSTANPRTDYNITTNKSITANFVANDPNAPVISHVASSPSESTSVVTWTTDEASSSQVQYGLNTSYGFSTTESDTVSRATSHSVSLADLKSCARYYYRVLSKDATNNQSASSQKTFHTLGCTTSSIINGSENLLPVSGGTVELVNNLSTARLSVPDGYAAEDATFQINKLDTSAPPAGPSGKHIAKGNLYELIAVTTSDTQLTSFATPLTFTISYGNDTETDYIESTLDIYKYNGSSWDKKNCTLNTVANTLTCSLSGFSTYGVLGTPKQSANSTTSSSANNSSSGSSTNANECANTKPVSAPDLFEISANYESATIFFTPLSDTNTYFTSFSESADSESYGALAELYREGVQNYTVYKLKPKTRYYLKVRGQNGCMPGDWGNTMSFVTDGRVYYKNQRYLGSSLTNLNRSVNQSSVSSEDELSPTKSRKKQEISAPSYKNTVNPATTPTPRKLCILWWCW